MQRREFERRPDLVRVARELLARANGTDPNLPPRMPPGLLRAARLPIPANSRAHDLAYVAFLLAAIWNKQELGETASQALVGRGMAAVDQMARGGAPSLGFLWTPRWHLTVSLPHRPPSPPLLRV